MIEAPPLQGSILHLCESNSIFCRYRGRLGCYRLIAGIATLVSLLLGWGIRFQGVF